MNRQWCAIASKSETLRSDSILGPSPHLFCIRRVHRPSRLCPRRRHPRILHSNRAERIRLSGIDCPEKGQAYGTRAKQAASQLAFGKEVTIQTHGYDKYKRTLGDVFLLDGTNVNHTLVKDGRCWWYRKYAPLDTELERLEKDVRAGRKGLWADPQPVPPWEWRRRRD
jgi:micrococcal nuclease